MLSRKLFWLSLTLSVMAALIIAGCGVTPSGDQIRTELITVQVIITATPDPNASPEIIIITATLDRTQVAVPDGIVPETTASANGVTALQVTQSADTSAASTSNVPEGCLPHIVEDGDTIFGLADIYGVNPFIMLEVNGYTEDTAFLNIGDELIVPVEGCPIESIIVVTPVLDDSDTEVTEEVTAEVTSEATEPANLTPSPSPTITLPPTATNSSIEIVEVIRAGDVTAEGVRIRNNGRLVDVAGWTLTDADDNEYTFEELLIFSNAEHTIYTRASQNTPIASFWGLEEPIWEVGDVVTLRDEDGNVQAVLRITGDTDAP
ncbi:MAG: lamin tail domain-containing protein [Phototrophicaceae bacterium]